MAPTFDPAYALPKLPFALVEQKGSKEMNPQAHPDPDWHYRIPSGYEKCRGIRCKEKPVADLNRPYALPGHKPNWWAYCAKHLDVYNREVRDGQVWWKGTEE